MAKTYNSKSSLARHQSDHTSGDLKISSHSTAAFDLLHSLCPLGSVHASICLGRWLSSLWTRFPSSRGLRWSSKEDMHCMLALLRIEVLHCWSHTETLRMIHRQHITKPCKRSTWDWVTTAHSRPYKRVARMTDTMILSLVCACILYLCYHNTWFRDYKPVTHWWCDGWCSHQMQYCQDTGKCLLHQWGASSSQTTKNPRLFLSVALLSVVTETLVAA